MDQQHPIPHDTREFMAMWNSATTDHLAHKLTGVLQELAGRTTGLPPIGEREAEALSPILIRALQVAAAPEGGVHAAVQFLAQYGAEAG